MPEPELAGTPKNYSKTDTFISSADIWLRVAKPAEGGVITLFEDGTPEANANPGAIHLGMTTPGDTKISYKGNIERFFASQFRSAWRTIIASEEAMIEGNWLQLFNPELLEAMTLGSRRSTDVEGWERLGFGGSQVVETFSVVAIGRLASNPDQLAVFHIFEAFNQAGYEATWDMRAPSQSPFSFVAEADTGRAEGDQVAYLAWQLAPEEELVGG